jgi:hypothetical protein
MKPVLAEPPAANPTLSTILEVEGILEQESRTSALPLSFAEIERRMQAKKTRPETIKAAVQALVHYGVAAVGSKGVLYTRTPQSVAGQAVEALA